MAIEKGNFPVKPYEITIFNGYKSSTTWPCSVGCNAVLRLCLRLFVCLWISATCVRSWCWEAVDFTKWLVLFGSSSADSTLPWVLRNAWVTVSLGFGTKEKRLTCGSWPNIGWFWDVLAQKRDDLPASLYLWRHVCLHQRIRWRVCKTMLNHAKLRYLIDNDWYELVDLPFFAG